MRGHVKPMLCGATADEVQRRLAAKADWTVRALAADLKVAGIHVSHVIECKFTEPDGQRSQTALLRSGDRQCNGSYADQIDPANGRTDLVSGDHWVPLNLRAARLRARRTETPPHQLIDPTLFVAI